MTLGPLRRWTPHDIPRGTRVLLRLEVNGRVGDGESQFRWQQALPEVRALRARGAIVIVLGHIGDPGGAPRKELRMTSVASWFAQQLARDIPVLSDPFSAHARTVLACACPGDVFFLENLRFWPGEEANDAAFSCSLAELADVYVNNAFGVLHRAHASVVGIPRHLPSFAGELVEREVAALSAKKPAPFVLFQGGAKLSTKLPLLEKLLPEVADVYVGGALAVPLAVAAGHTLPHAIRAALSADDLRAAEVLLRVGGKKVRIPQDFVLNHDLTRVLDIGPRAIDDFTFAVRHARSVFWNGPLGVIEDVHGQEGSRALARALQAAHLPVAVAGGGETVGFLCAEGMTHGFTHLSTGGGATLAYLAGQELPGLVTLCGSDRCIL